MLSRKELEIYRDELIKENTIGLRSIKLLSKAIVRNKLFTSGLTPKSTKSINDACWADQWMALSENFSGRCQCASCGKYLFADVTDLDCLKLVKAYQDSKIDRDCTPESLQIQGGHIELTQDIVNGTYLLARKGSTFIVPLCKKCNNFNVGTLKISSNTIITPEIK